ncbi:hypothetical protein KAR91_35655 [Candidatus Pacearchaeota archaeon]|nr:hypothetical protein [Candidatus Pacearchaeota archaeon]
MDMCANCMYGEEDAECPSCDIAFSGYVLKGGNKEVIEKLKKEIELLKAELREEEKVVDYYSKLENWNLYKNVKATQRIRVSPMDDCSKHSDAGWGLCLGGKRARQRIKERKEI